MKKSMTVTLTLLSLILIVALVYVIQTNKIPANTTTQQSDSAVPSQTAKMTQTAPEISPNQLWVKDHSPIMGPKNAPVTLVEFIDPACEACRAMYPYVKQIMKTYPDEVRLVIRYVNFHDQSVEAIRILEAARKQGQFKNTLEVLLAFQPAWAPHHKEAVDPWEFLTNTTLDIEKARKDAQDPAIDKIIELDMADVDAAGVQKTPSFFVNGKPLKLMHPDPLLEMIKTELEATKTL